jgi:hypothetical protein
MYDHQIICYDYLAVEKVASKIKWRQIADKHKIKKSFGKVMRHLANKGYVSDQGKSGAVYSLTDLGVFYAIGKLKEKNSN